MTHRKSKKKLPELSGGKGSRESKQVRKSEPLMPTTVSSSLTLTPTSNLSATLFQSITSNGTFCSTIQTLQLDDLSTAPTFEVKMSAKTKKPAYSVNFCNSAETLAECLKYVTNPKSVPCWVRRRYCLAGTTKLGEQVAKNTKLEWQSFVYFSP